RAGQAPQKRLGLIHSTFRPPSRSPGERLKSRSLPHVSRAEWLKAFNLGPRPLHPVPASRRCDFGGHPLAAAGVVAGALKACGRCVNLAMLLASAKLKEGLG